VNKDRDDIGALLRLAGKRQPVPDDRTRRVRAAAHAKWREQVNRRSRARVTWAAAAAAAFAAVLLAVMLVGRDTPPASGGSLATIEALFGAARIAGGDSKGSATGGELEVGGKIAAGTVLVTDARAGVALHLASGASVRLDESTRLRLVDHESLELTRGAVYVDSGVAPPGRDAGGHLAVLTPFGEVRDVGTQFEVRLGHDALRVRLREGRVEVEREDGAHLMTGAGEMTVATDGTVTRRPLSAFGQEWEWLLDVTPVPDFEGRPVRELLDWVARERGWTLTFADADAARAAGETAIFGSLERLRVDQTLDAVMPASNLTYGVENGVLLVSRSD
jgi:ferric-dicitrate binding protein FerR (iron transport regulator)